MATKKKHTGAKRYLRTRMTFSHSVMVPVGCSQILTHRHCRCVKIRLQYSLILLDVGVKINEICYCSLLPPQQLLPVIHQVSGKFRNNAPVYWSRYFSDINISQRSVAARLWCGEKFQYKFPRYCMSERIMKIGE